MWVAEYPGGEWLGRRMGGISLALEEKWCGWADYGWVELTETAEDSLELAVSWSVD